MIVRARLALVGVLLGACALAAAGCGAVASGEPGSGTVRVVAAENFWGSIASQLGGDRATVKSIITNPNEDPHSYEPTASDARAARDARSS